MVKMKTTTVMTLKFPVEVRQEYIDEGECRKASLCMQKVAVTEALGYQLGLSANDLHKLHVRVDAGHIKFNYDGCRKPIASRGGTSGQKKLSPVLPA
jgi:hypothetical protein